MQILINNRNGVPIYDQIFAQIKEQILQGTLAEDEPLPSIRSLAKDLCISVITTKRAYEELEKEGLIYPVPAKGFYVAPLDVAMVREQHLRKIEEHMEEIGRLAAQAGITKEELASMMDEILASSEETHSI